MKQLGGKSPVIRRLRYEIDAIAPTESSVLITGETGTGKGLVARLIHDASRRSEGRFVHVDCASLAESVIESELFGHERGAFTGAIERRQGRFELAERGTLFLDEIGELEPRLQAKLLRVLQDREYERIGGTRTLQMTARVIAATNQDLPQAIAAKRFRADLYYRLKVVSLSTPPLRERPEDIPLLLDRCIEELAERLGVEVPYLDESFLASLARHSWPGNVRELLNVVERAMIFGREGRLRADEIDLGGLHDEGPRGFVAAQAPPAASDQFSEEVPAQGARERLVAALTQTGGNVARAARRLEMPRSTLRYQIQVHSLQALIPGD
ncbi:MAG: sigma-54 dependent transcriptional regulator [Candidatus Binatia bacterium]|nr:sigma-54 dependent transcriptional regulator [Candidatus Binatia bacterium]